MKQQAKRFVPVLAAVSLAFAGVALSQPAPSQPKDPAAAPGQPADSGSPRQRQPVRPGSPEGRPGDPAAPVSIDRAMKGTNRAIRQLRGQVTDSSKKDENLRLVSDAQRGLVLAKGQPLPDDVLKNAKDDAAKAQMNAAFRKDLIGALHLLLDIETDIADGKGDAAKAKLEELIKKRDAAHKELGVKDEE